MTCAATAKCDTLAERTNDCARLRRLCFRHRPRPRTASPTAWRCWLAQRTAHRAAWRGAATNSTSWRRRCSIGNGCKCAKACAYSGARTACGLRPQSTMLWSTLQRPSEDFCSDCATVCTAGEACLAHPVAWSDGLHCAAVAAEHRAVRPQAADCARLRLTRLGTDGTTLGECPEWHNHSITHSRLNQACLFALQIVQAKDSVTQMSYQLDMVRRLRNRSLANGGMCLGWARDGMGWDGMGWAGPIGAQISCGRFFALALLCPSTEGAACTAHSGHYNATGNERACTLACN